MAYTGKKASTLFSSSTTSEAKTAMASDEYYEIYCQTCDEDGPRLPAFGYCTDCKEHLCKDCFKFHSKHRLSKNHTLLDAKRMPRLMQQKSVSSSTCESDDLSTPCFDHPKELIKFYCKEHKKLLCNVCVTLKHTPGPCKVNYIPDISGEFINGKEYHAKLKEMDNITDRYNKVIEDLKKMTAKSNKSLAVVLEDIKKFRKDIIQRLDEMERKAEHEVKMILHENENYLKKIESTHIELINSLTLSSSSIKEFNTSDQANKLFMALKVAEEKIADSKRNIDHLQSSVVTEYGLKVNEAVFKLFENEKSIGSLVPKTSSETSLSKHVQLKSRKLSHQGKISLRAPQDEVGCQISGIVLLTPDIIIITDQENDAVKMVNVRSRLVTYHLLLESKPRDVTFVTSDKIAVTLPIQQKVQFITISSNKLKKTHAVEVDGACHGISYYQEKLVVSFYNPAKLQILDMNGVILSNVKNIFKNPLHVTTSSSSIYVSDWGMKSVMRLSWNGRLFESYCGMRFPSGLTRTDDGTIFVCDHERCVIEEIFEDCSAGRIVLKELEGPYVVCWCAETRKLYCCSFTSNGEEDSFLHIYKMSETQ